MVPIIATVKSWAVLMAAVGESVSNNKRKGDGQRKFQEEAGKTKKKKYNCKHKQTWEKD